MQQTMIIDLNKSAGKKLEHALMDVGEWNSANPTHPRSANGRFMGATAAGHEAVADLLHGMVKEHKGEKTKLGAAILDMIGRPSEPRRPRKTAAERVDESLLTAAGRARDRQATGALLRSTGVQHDEIVRQLDQEFGKDPFSKIAEELHAIPTDSGEAGMERARKLLAGHTLAELKQIAEAVGPTAHGKGTKAKITESIIDGTLGHRQRSHAIGGWGEGGGAANLGEALAKPTKGRLTPERFEGAYGAGVSDSLFGKEPLMGSRAWNAMSPEEQRASMARRMGGHDVKEQEKLAKQQEAIARVASEKAKADAHQARMDVLFGDMSSEGTHMRNRRLAREAKQAKELEKETAKPGLGEGRGSLLGDRVGERSLSTIIENPEPSDRDLFDELTKGMTLAQLKQMAAEREVIFPGSGDKASRRTQLRETLFGFKLNSQNEKDDWNARHSWV